MTSRTRQQLRLIIRPLAEAMFCLFIAPILYVITALIFAL